MDLFDFMGETSKKESPLASRLRPVTLDEIVGQRHILGKNCLLYRAIKADKLGSVIFYGPPGTGKTTIARVIAETTSSEFIQLNATTAGKKEMEEAVAKAKKGAVILVGGGDGRMDKAYETACTLLHHANCRDIHAGVYSHNTNQVRAVEDAKTVEGVESIARFFNG